MDGGHEQSKQRLCCRLFLNWIRIFYLGVVTSYSCGILSRSVAMWVLQYPVDTQPNNPSVLQFTTMKMLSDDIRIAPYKNTFKHRQACIQKVISSFVFGHWIVQLAWINKSQWTCVFGKKCIWKRNLKRLRTPWLDSVLTLLTLVLLFFKWKRKEYRSGFNGLRIQRLRAKSLQNWVIINREHLGKFGRQV